MPTIYSKRELHRALYEKVKSMNEIDIDFSLKATVQEFNYNKNTFCNCFYQKQR